MQTCKDRPLRFMGIVLFSACASGAFAAGPTPVHSCGAISAAGSYVLTHNLNVSGSCIDVTAPDVTLDFDGFAITGDGTGHGLEAMLGSGGLTVKNGTISSFGVGITLLTGAPPDVPGAIIEHMRVVNSFNFGIGGGAAVVRDSVVTGNGNTGIGLGAGSLVTGNRVVGNRAGINVQEGSVVSGNVVTSNTLSGITANCPSLVLGNVATGSNINLGTFGANCTVEHNTAP